MIGTRAISIVSSLCVSIVSFHSTAFVDTDDVQDRQSTGDNSQNDWRDRVDETQEGNILCQVLLTSAVIRGGKNLSTHVDVADSTDDRNRNCPEDAQKPHKCSK
jgi:hypothetical protein